MSYISFVFYLLATAMDLTVGEPLWSRMKYLNNYQIDWNDILNRHSWFPEVDVCLILWLRTKYLQKESYLVCVFYSIAECNLSIRGCLILSLSIRLLNKWSSGPQLRMIRSSIGPPQKFGCDHPAAMNASSLLISVFTFHQDHWDQRLAEGNH